MTFPEDQTIDQIGELEDATEVNEPVRKPCRRQSALDLAHLLEVDHLPWDIERDARKYGGPHPIVAHPPCGPWGKYHKFCKQSKDDGIISIEMVHRFGGVIEQPTSSRLFREHGLPFVEVTTLNQSAFGFRSKKPTQLYMVWQPEKS